MSRVLAISWASRRVGTLEQADSGQLEFSYDPDWLSMAEPRPLSQSLPLQQKTFDHASCRPFFAGLLPEAEKRDLIARGLGISPRNDFALLDRIGGECAGAITFLPPDAPAPGPTSPSDYTRLPRPELDRILRLLPERPLLAGEEGIRLSLAGAQDKLPVLVRGGEIFLPLGAAPSSHIIKPQIPRFPDTVANEALCLLLAAQLDLHAVEAQICTTEDQRFLLVARYDRVQTGDDHLVRLHQEDFCQALSIPPELKYQSEGGPSLSQCFDLVRSVATRPAIALARLLDYVIFNVLVGNNDAHGKNYSLLYLEDGRVELAPLYDAMCTQVYPGLSPKMAMKIGGKSEPDRVLPRHWDRLAFESGLAAPLVRRRVVELSTLVERMAAAAASTIRQSDRSPLLERITTFISSRAAAVRRNFESEPKKPRR